LCLLFRSRFIRPFYIILFSLLQRTHLKCEFPYRTENSFHADLAVVAPAVAVGRYASYTSSVHIRVGFINFHRTSREIERDCFWIRENWWDTIIFSCISIRKIAHEVHRTIILLQQFRRRHVEHHARCIIINYIMLNDNFEMLL